MWYFKIEFQVEEFVPKDDEVKEVAASENNRLIKTQSNGDINQLKLKSSSPVDSQAKTSGLALEDLILQQYEQKLPQKDDVSNCDMETGLENKVSLVTSHSLEEKPYRELDPLSSMATQQTSLNLHKNKNSHVSVF